jgi:orotate phosphoribosyltransferase
MVIIEDLISTGGSVLDACEAASREGSVVLGVAAIFTYQLPKATANFIQHNIPLTTLTDYDTLITVALEKGTIQAEDLSCLNDWKKDPTGWKKD